jgi:DNA end-binding protein Ku
MRSIWKGAITFGLVNVPVKLYSALESHDVPLHQVHDDDGGRIRYHRTCEVCEQTIPYEHIDRAYDDGEHTVVLTKEDFAVLPSEQNREIEVVEFVPSDQIDPVLFDRTYYLEPDTKSPKAYVLLRRTLEETDRTAIVRFALRQKTRLAALRVREGVLTVQTLLWADEVRDADFPKATADVKISPQEMKMSSALVESFSSDFEPEQYTDEYQEELRKLVEAKIEAGDAIDTDATFGKKPDADEDAGGDVIDLMEALRRSVESSRAKRTGQADVAADDGDAPAPALKKRAAPKKAPAKKRAAGDDDAAPTKRASPKKTTTKKKAVPDKPAAKAGAKKPADDAKKAPARTKAS